LRARTWSYFVRSSVNSVMDNGLMSLASISTMAISLLVLAAFALLALNLQYMGRVLDAQVQIVAYLQPSFDRSQTASLMSQVRAIPGVVSAQFVSREQALSRLESEFGTQKNLLASVQQHNPLPDSIEVRPQGRTTIQQVATALGRLPGVASVDYKQQVVQRLYAFTNALRLAGYVVVAGLSLATVLLIANTVRLAVYARREEIGIMKLVGATDSFVRWPFLIEGALLGAAGAAVAAGVTWWGYSLAVRSITRTLPFVPMLAGGLLLERTAAALLVLGVILGGVGSSWSVNRFLRV
jgi:cell division transport system permease protein